MIEDKLSRYFQAENLPEGHLVRLAIDELKQMRAERDEAQCGYERACITVVRMHSAATGQAGFGPKRGVVEDVGDLRAERDALLALLRETKPLVTIGRDDVYALPESDGKPYLLAVYDRTLSRIDAAFAKEPK